jgi:peptidoglycan/LPS O-acetylase OafA/YrhL
MAAPWILGLAGLRAGRASGAAAMAASVALAAVSFYALERPMLRLKRRFERVGGGTPNSP